MCYDVGREKYTRSPHGTYLFPSSPVKRPFRLLFAESASQWAGGKDGSRAASSCCPGCLLSTPHLCLGPHLLTSSPPHLCPHRLARPGCSQLPAVAQLPRALPEVVGPLLTEAPSLPSLPACLPRPAHTLQPAPAGGGGARSHLGVLAALRGEWLRERSAVLPAVIAVKHAVLPSDRVVLPGCAPACHVQG